MGSRHASVQRLRRLSGRRSARLDEGAFVIDGPVLVREALVAGIALDEAFAAPSADPAVVAALDAAGVPVHEVTEEVLARSVDTVTPHGLAAVAHRTVVTLDAAVAAAVSGPLALVLVDVGDPGNAGTLLRGAEAAGASVVVFSGSSVDPTNPKCVRASAGALFHVPVAVEPDAAALAARLQAAGVRTVATVVDGGQPYDRCDLDGPIAVLLGSEAHGLSAAMLDDVDLLVSIPMAGRSDSLNVAMAGTLLCFESLRRRRTPGAATLPEPIGDGPA